MASEMFWLGFTYRTPIDTGEQLVVIDEEELHETAQGEYRMWLLMERIDKMLAPEVKKSWRKIWRITRPSKKK